MTGSDVLLMTLPINLLRQTDILTLITQREYESVIFASVEKKQHIRTIGVAVGSVIPVAGNIVGAGVGMAAGWLIDKAVNAEIFSKTQAIQ